MTKAIAVLSGIGIGAALMFIFDPKGGGRRRALVRDKAVGLSNDATKAIGSKSRDLRNRAEGLMHEAKSLVARGEKETSETTDFGRAV